MPPKAAADKGKKGKSNEPLRQVNPLEYVRKPTPLEVITDAGSVRSNLKANVINVETLFPEFNSQAIEDEVWDSLPDHPSEVIVDNHRVAKIQSLKVFVGLEEEQEFSGDKHSHGNDKKGSKGGTKPKTPKKNDPPKKPDPKKGKAPISHEFVEQIHDETGKLLPRVFMGEHSSGAEAVPDDLAALTGFDWTRGFRREFSPAQVKRRNKQDMMKEAANQSAVGTDKMSEEESQARIAKAKSEYEKLISKRDMTKEEPAGAELDPYMCAAFKIVQQYAKPFCQSDEKKMPFLWRAIYPQTSHGRPCYNPGGKYCVKLFLAGKWRLVTVFDTVPIREDGSPAIATSSNPLELWPFILAKAVYAAYAACGYDRTMPTTESPQADSADIAQFQLQDDIATTCAALRVSFFVGFAVHVLTGWQPGNAWELADLIQHDPARTTGLLQEVLFGGAFSVSSDELPGDEPGTGVAAESSASAGDSPKRRDVTTASPTSKKPSPDIVSPPSWSETDGPVIQMKTKKQFKEDFRRRLAEREAVTSAIAAREEKIKSISTALAKAFSEFFILCIPASTGAVEVVPVLGLSFPPNSDDILQVKVLISWQSGKPKARETSQSSSTAESPSPSPSPLHRSTSSSSAGGGLGSPQHDADIFAILKSPLPPATPVTYVLVTLQDLMARGAYMLGVDTSSRTPHRAVLGWHWEAAAMETRAKTPAKTDKKGQAPKASTPKASDNNHNNKISTDPGALPPVLLSVDTTSFFDVVPLDPVDVIDKEAQAAIEEQRRMLEGGGGEGGGDDASQGGRVDSTTDLVSIASAESMFNFNVVPKSTHLSLSVSIHADLLCLPPDRPDSPKSKTHSTDSLASADGSDMSHPFVPDDVVLVLQELTWDGEDPLVMRVELAKDTLVPITRATFHIPVDRIPIPSLVAPTAEAGVPTLKCAPFVFWVRMFTKASVYVTFGSGAPITTGAAETVWKGLGYHAITLEGDADTTRPSTEQLLFRVPISLRPNDERDPFPSMGDPLPKSKSSGSLYDSVISFLHIADRDISRTCSLMLLNPAGDAISGDGHSLPRLSGNVIPVAMQGESESQRIQSSHLEGAEKLLVGRTFPFSAIRGTVPPFHWKLLLLSRREFLQSQPVSYGKAVEQRYTGNYIPNNRLVLFRDVLSVDKNSFPLALRLTTLPSAQTAPEAPLDLNEDLCVVLRFFRKDDRVLVGECRGRSVVQVYDLSPDHFGLEGEQNSSAAPVSPTPSKNAPSPKKGDAKAKAPAVEPLDFILECSVDEEAMHVPPRWRSKQPFQFDGKLATTTSPPEFTWRLDILAGTVLSVSHDTFDLERQAALKNKWEEDREGRTKCAAAALSFYQLQQSLDESKLSLVDSSMSDEAKIALEAKRQQVVEAMAAATGKSSADLLPRFEIVESNAKLHAFHEKEPLSTLISTEDLLEGRTRRDEEEIASKAAAAEAIQMLTSFHNLLKEATSSRVDTLMTTAHDNSVKLSSLWSERENFRQMMNSKNASLEYLLNRGSQAIEAVLADEQGPPQKGDKKGAMETSKAAPKTPDNKKKVDAKKKK